MIFVVTPSIRRRFRLLMNCEVTGILSEADLTNGVTAKTPSGTLEVYASLVVGCDGRHSVIRRSLGLEVTTLGAPMDATTVVGIIYD